MRIMYLHLVLHCSCGIGLRLLVKLDIGHFFGTSWEFNVSEKHVLAYFVHYRNPSSILHLSDIYIYFLLVSNSHTLIRFGPRNIEKIRSHGYICSFVLVSYQGH